MILFVNDNVFKLSRHRTIDWPAEVYSFIAYYFWIIDALKCNIDLGNLIKSWFCFSFNDWLSY